MRKVEIKREKIERRFREITVVISLTSVYVVRNTRNVGMLNTRSAAPPASTDVTKFAVFFSIDSRGPARVINSVRLILRHAGSDASESRRRVAENRTRLQQ